MDMDAVNTAERETVKDIPPIPIQTYKWEDVRRAKRKGRYPYTHLNKHPYNEEIDPSEFRMDTLKTSKSTSVLEKSSSGVDIQDVTESKSLNNGKDYLEVEGIVDTVDSSNEDNVSQYLDKDDDPPIIMEHIEVPGPSVGDEKMDVEDRQDQRAKSEEPKRKRKLSIESSYSRISLSKLGVMKKLREAKDKLKLPKFSFSKSESKLDIPKKSKKEEKKPKEGPKKNLDAFFEPKKETAPVYIHIPLKPPAGQTDEFSYLEFEDPNSETPEKPTSSASLDKPEEEKRNGDESKPSEENQKGVQFIILTAPSDDEVLDDHTATPDTPAEGGKKFFDNAKLKDLKSLARECVDEITPDMPIDGIIFEDVIQVEYVDEHNNPIGTTERSNILEVTEENLSKIEKQLSQRNLAKELQKEIASSMDSLHKIARHNTLKKLKEQQKSKSNETLKKVGGDKKQTTQEAPELTICTISDNTKENSKEIKNEEIKESTSEKLKEVKTETPVEEKKEVPTLPEQNPPKEEGKKEAMYDEEDGLKLSETAVQMINEELAKEQLPNTTEEQLKSAAKSGSVKKKVSFRRRSKQQDPDGIYEDVRVTSDGKKVDGKEQQTKELKVIEPSQSMSVDEEKTYLDDKVIKATSLEEDYNKWSKVTDHEYEPISPPTETEVQQQQEPLEIQVPDEQVKRTSSKQSKKSPSNSIRIRLKDEASQSEEEMDSEDALTAKEMQERIEDQFFNKTTSSTKPEDHSTGATTATNASNKENEPQESHAKKFQDAFKTQAEKFRSKFQNIKKPNIHMPQRPNLEKFKIQKPNINMPKIPDSMRVNLPSFTLPKRGGSAKKRPVKQYSTESNVGDSKKKIFDFSTYPRIFRKKKKTDDLDDDDLDASASVPPTKKTPKSNSGKSKDNEKGKKSPDVVRIPLHSKESMDKENELPSHERYEEHDIDMDDDYLRETQEMHTASSAFSASDFSRNRWNHGSFHGHNLNEIADNETTVKVTDLDNDIEHPQTSSEPEIESEPPRESDVRSQSMNSSGDIHKPGGVLEKINSDEYFMQMGNYLSTELREAFKQPTNPLAKLEADDSFDREFDVSDQSIQEVPKRRAIKKPKRKNTPNVSTEGLPYDQESEPEEYQQQFIEQPTRPKRKGKQKKKKKDEKPPYQETFAQDPEFEMRKAASDNILSPDKGMRENFYDGHFRQGYPQLYENERMQGIEQPNILISPYAYQKQDFSYHDDEDDDGINLNGYEKDMPEAPPRKQKSLKSLASEHDSISDEINFAKQNIPQVEVYKLEHEYIIPRSEEPPLRPFRTRSRTRSQSRITDQPEDEPLEITEMPCVEEPCVQQVCDYMGYAVIEKNKNRDPPLPPPSRRKKSPNTSAKSEPKFFTVPRPLKEDVPMRPVRNYSTLVPKSKRSPTNLSEEEKENVDIGQYIEIDEDDEHSRLQSGEIVQKMKDRPLPAPPRPPRKSKDSDKDALFNDITHENNLDKENPSTEKLKEAEVSVQTEPLPDDLVCEDLVQEKGDKIITPSTTKTHPPITEFENIETVTHGALVVAPVADDFQEVPLTTFSRSTEKIITIRREVDHEDETSDIPENFKDLKEPQQQPQIVERIIEHPIQSNSEVEVLRAQKLQVSDLDIDRLMVNELLANKIKVSEIDSESISVAEINPKSGNLVIGGFELPINFLKDIVEKLTRAQSSSGEQPITSKSEQSQQGESKSGTVIPTEEETKMLVKEKDVDPSTETEKGDKIPEQIEATVPLKVDDQEIASKQEEGAQTDTESTMIVETKVSFEYDPELSPTTLKTTIDYLDDLIREENLLNAQQIVEKSAQIQLESAAVESTNEQPVNLNLFAKQSSGEEKSDSVDLQDVPPLVLDSSEEERLIEELKSSSPEQKKTPIEKLDEPPRRPPRQSDTHKLQQSHEDIFIPSQVIENSHNILFDESTPPPRPPDPEERLYLRSQPPASFYVLRSPALDDFIDEDIPMPPRRKRTPRPPSRSSSEEAPPTVSRSRRHRTPEPSIPQLTGQLTRACVTAGEKSLKRLVKHITMNVLRNADGQQDLHIMILILLILIAGLILLGNGDNPIVHHYHWEYFNPPRDI